MSEAKATGGGKFVKKPFFFLQKNTSVPNKFIFNKDLCDSAKLLLIALEALPETWDVYQNQLASMLQFGKDKMQKAMSCLIEHGYMRRVQTKGEKNRFSHYEYEFYWEPVFKNGAEVQPDEPPKYEEESDSTGAVFSGTGDSGTGKPATSRSIDYSLSNINTNLIEPPTPEAPKNEKSLVGGFHKQSKEENKIYQCLQKVDIPEKDKIRLTKQFSEDVVIKSVAHCTKPSFKPNTTLDSSIFYFSKNPSHITETKEEIEAKKLKEEEAKSERAFHRKRAAEQVKISLWQKARELGVSFYETYEYMEVSNERVKERLYFSDEKFTALLSHLLGKIGLEVPAFLRRIA